MRRTLIRSPAFGRDLRKWLKPHADTAASIEATLEQLSADGSASVAANTQVARFAGGLLGLLRGLRSADRLRVHAVRRPRGDSVAGFGHP